jgi:hypothetical protein
VFDFPVLPSGIQPDEPTERSAKEVAKGLYVVPTSYQGVYNYFGHSPLLNLSRHPKPAASNGSRGQFRVTEDGVVVADGPSVETGEPHPDPS